MARDTVRKTTWQFIAATIVIVALSAVGCSSGGAKNRRISAGHPASDCPLTQSIAQNIAPGLTENPGAGPTGCGYSGSSASVGLTVIRGSNYAGHTASDLLQDSYRNALALPGSMNAAPELGAGAYEHVDPDGVASQVGWIQSGRYFLLIVETPGGSYRALSAALAIYEQLGGTPGPSSAPSSPTSGCSSIDLTHVQILSINTPHVIKDALLARSDPSWARFHIAPVTPGAADTLTGFAHCTDGRWTVVDYGSFSVGCKTVPQRLWSELGIIECSPSASAPTSAGSMSPSSVFVLNCPHGAQTARPKSLLVTCADAGILLTDIQWHSWGDSSAVGTGTLTENDCTPDCADGTDVSEPARVTLSKIKSIGTGGRLYTEMTVTPTPPNVHQFQPITRPLP